VLSKTCIRLNFDYKLDSRIVINDEITQTIRESTNSARSLSWELVCQRARYGETFLIYDDSFHRVSFTWSIRCHAIRLLITALADSAEGGRRGNLN
jgi:hypothetical protein